MTRIHGRMPVVLEPQDFELWLDPGQGEVERLGPLLRPAAAGVLEMHPVSSYVNRAGNEGERCIERVELGD